jgi:hypothetical protein
MFAILARSIDGNCYLIHTPCPTPYPSPSPVVFVVDDYIKIAWPLEYHSGSQNEHSFLQEYIKNRITLDYQNIYTNDLNLLTKEHDCSWKNDEHCVEIISGIYNESYSYSYSSYSDVTFSYSYSYSYIYKDRDTYMDIYSGIYKDSSVYSYSYSYRDIYSGTPNYIISSSIIESYSGSRGCCETFSNSYINSYVFRPTFYLLELYNLRLYYVYFSILGYKVEVRIIVFDYEIESSMRFNFLSCVSDWPYWYHIDFQCEPGLGDCISDSTFIEFTRVNDNLEVVFEL